MIELGVNIDHVATLRQVRGTTYPDPVRAAVLGERAGADAITLHLREDRRHIQDRDVAGCAADHSKHEPGIGSDREMLQIALRVRPHDVCLVPERRRSSRPRAASMSSASERVRDAACCSPRRASACRCSSTPIPPRSTPPRRRRAGDRAAYRHYADHRGRDETGGIHELAASAWPSKASARRLKVNAGHG